jgi:hypothetical protein
MTTLEKVRAMFPLDAHVECVENTYRPELNGTRRRVTRVQKQRLGVEVLTGPGAGKPFDLVLPSRAGDVLALTSEQVTFRLGREEHTVTYRVLRQERAQPRTTPSECVACGEDLQGNEQDVCRECANEAAGMCRWCGARPPLADDYLCRPCAAHGDAAVETGAF